MNDDLLKRSGAEISAAAAFDADGWDICDHTKWFLRIDGMPLARLPDFRELLAVYPGNRDAETSFGRDRPIADVGIEPDEILYRDTHGHDRYVKGRVTARRVPGPWVPGFPDEVFVAILPDPGGGHGGGGAPALQLCRPDVPGARRYVLDKAWPAEEQNGTGT